MSSPTASVERRPAPLQAPLKATRCFFTTPGDLATAYGGFWRYQGTGELALYPDRLIFTGGSRRSDIPFASLVQLGSARAPNWPKGAAHRYLAIDYDDQGRRKTLLVIPGERWFRTAGATVSAAAEWTTTIRETVKAATGRDVPCATQPSTLAISPWGSVMVFTPLLLFQSLFLWFVHTMLDGAPGAGATSSIPGFWILMTAPVVVILVMLIIFPIVKWYTAKQSWRELALETAGPSEDSPAGIEPRRTLVGYLAIILIPFFFLALVMWQLSSMVVTLKNQPLSQPAPPRATMPNPYSQDGLLAALRLLSDHDGGQFPDQLDQAAVTAATLDATKRARVGKKPGEPNDPAVLSALAEEMLVLRNGPRFFTRLPAEADAHYAGKGIKRGDANSPILWYRPPGAENYRVIYGDLSVKEQDGAPEVPATAP